METCTIRRGSSLIASNPLGGVRDKTTTPKIKIEIITSVDDTFPLVDTAHLTNIFSGRVRRKGNDPILTLILIIHSF